MANPTPAKTLIIMAPELLQALPAEELPQGAQVLWLVHGVDPINQIKAALQERANNPVEALRIISPGEPGSLLLAGHRITAASLATRSADLAAWSTGLAQGADILLYGSSIAARTDGVALVNALAQATGRDAAASRNASGAGGDTLFEVTSGTIGATALADRAAWQGSGVRLSTNQTQLVKNIGAFAALKNDGSIAVWGNQRYGGDQAKAPSGTGYSQIFSNGGQTGGGAFAALKNDGSIAVWGNQRYGGDQAKAPSSTGYSQIFSNGGFWGGAFAGLKNDGSIAVWGNQRYDGDQAKAPSGTGFASIQIANDFVPLTFDPTTSFGGAQVRGATGEEIRNLSALSTKPGSVAAPRQPGDPLDLVFISPEIVGSVPQEELAGARVVVLDAGEDVIGQVGAALQANPGATVVRLISHGQPGSLMLAGQRISLDTLELRAEEIAGWRRHLTPGADILLYGCSVAGTAEGRLFVDSISSLAGVDVAASTDLTGSAPLGGDLVLEYATGPIQAFSNRFGSAWDASGLTLPVTFSHGGSGATGALFFTSQSSDQFTLTNASPGFTFSSLSNDFFGNDATLVTSGIANPPLTTSSPTRAVFDTTVKNLVPTIAAGSTFSLDRDATFTSISGAGTVNISGPKFNNWTATLSGGSGTATFSGVLTNGSAGINSPLALKLNQAGFTQILSGTNDYAGATKINAGTLQVNGKNTNSPVTIAGGTLSGSGTVASVTMNSGTFSPGAPFGIFNTGNLLFSGGTFAAKLDSSFDYSRANVTGIVTLGSNTTLTLSPTFTPSSGDYFTLINNDGTDAVSGGFKGLAEGAKINVNGTDYAISYKGGTGNDVILIASPPPSLGPTVKITSSLGKLSSSRTAVLIFELSAASKDFTAADISVTNGSLSGFQVVAGSSGKQYSATFTPATNTKADAVITVAAGRFSESADSTKTNVSPASLRLPIDTTPPALVSLGLAAKGELLDLVMSQPLANGLAGAPALPPSSAFALQADGQAVAINAIAANGTSLSLTLAAPIAESVKQLTLTYTDPSSGDDAAALQDLAGQDAAGFTGVLSNQAPVLTYNPGTSPTPKFIEGSAAVPVLPGSLSLSDSDSQAFSQARVNFGAGFTAGDQLAVTIAQGTPIQSNYNPQTGQLTLIGEASAAEYRKVLGTLSFKHDGLAPTSLSTTRSLAISLRDTGGSGLAPQTSQPITVSFNVVGINSGVTLNPAALNPSVTVKAGSGAPVAGQLPSGAIKVSDLVRTGNGGNVTDPDGDQTGIAITGRTLGFNLFYSTNNGATWQAADNLSETSARLLWADDTTWVYLQYPGTNLGTASSALTYRAWDRNTPSTVTTPYVNGQGSVNIGSGSTSTRPSPFSSATDTLSVTRAGNASPTLVMGLQSSLNPISANSTAPQKGENSRGTLVRDLIRDTQQSTPRDLISDTDSQDARGIAITAVASGLDLYFSSDNGGNWTKANAVSASSALLLLADATTRLQLVSATPSNAARTVPAALTLKAWDGNGTGLTNGKQGVNTTQNTVVGGSPFSPTTTTASLQLQQQNQAPSAALPGGKAVLDLGSNFGDNAQSVVTQSDGKILIAGYTAAQPAGGQFISDNYGVVRLKADGSLDTSFGTGGKALLDLGTNSNDLAYSVVTQSDGKILIAGYTYAQPAGGKGSSNNYGVVRLNANGTLDTNFGISGKALLDLGTNTTDVANSVVTQTDGKILIAGYTDAQPVGGSGISNNYGVVRLNANGTLDTTFGISGKALLDLGTNTTDVANSVVTQTDGKILIVGITNAKPLGGSGSSNNYGVVRLNANGTLDSNFGISGKALLDLGTNTTDSAFSVVTQSDGKILIAGTTNAQPAGGKGSSNNYGVVRLNANGTLDPNFGTSGKALLDLGTDSADNAYSVVTQSDGKILIAGLTNAQPVGGKGDSINYGVVRLKADGSLDTSFGTGGKALLDLGTDSADNAYSMVMQSDGKILIAGYTDAQPAGGTGTSNNYGVVRLNADGSLDTTFNTPTSLDGKANYLIGNAAVALDQQVTFSDPQLSVLNNGVGNYSGARLVLQRNGGANANDRFSGLGNLSLETPATNAQPGRVVLGSTSSTSNPLHIGSWSQSGGKLELLFNNNATQSALNEAASSIGYQFLNNTPPAGPIQIRWDFFDGNTGSQGLGGELSVSGTTEVSIAFPPNDNDSSVIRTGATSAVLPSTAISAATAAPVLTLRITDNDANADGTPDGGTTDDKPTTVTSLSFSADRSQFRLNYLLTGPDLATPVAGVLGADRKTVSFNFGETPLSIANNSSENYTLSAWMDPASQQAVQDNGSIGKLNFTATTQVKAAAAGSQVGFGSVSGHALTAVVTATTLRVAAPAKLTSGLDTSFSVEAVDAQGNRDVNATGTITLSLANGAGSLQVAGGNPNEAITGTLSNGVATFSKLRYLASADGEHFTLQAAGSGGATGLSGVSAAITADVVATRLQIQGDPSARELRSGQNNTINGLSVVGVDDDNTIDRDWLSGGSDGKAIVDVGTDSSDEAWSVVTQSDGKILIAGFTTAQPAGGAGTSNNYGVVRLLANGTLDTTFGTSGRALVDLGINTLDYAYSVVTQSDGKILIAGSTTAQPGGGAVISNNYGVVRLNANGTLDTTFGTSGRTLLDLRTDRNDEARSVVMQNDGKILIAGTTNANPVGGSDIFGNYGVVRLLDNGTLDTDFGTSGRALLDLGIRSEDLAYSVVTQSDGKILIAGYTTAQPAGAADLSYNYGVVRLLANGTLDTTFGTSGTALLELGTNSDDYARSVVTQSDGKILIAGNTTAQPADGKGRSSNYGVVRLLANGTLDTTFGTSGRAVVDLGTNSVDAAYSIVTQSDGKILIAGFTNAQPAGSTGSSNNFSVVNNFGVVRLNADGTVDNTFGTSGRALLDLGTNSNDEARSVVMQNDGKILIAGLTNAQPAGGRGSSRNFGLVRLNTDGSLDTTFNQPTLHLSLTSTNQQALAGTVSALGGIGTDRDNVPTTITLNAAAVDSSGRVDLGNLLINYTNAANSASDALALQVSLAGGLLSNPVALGPTFTSQTSLTANTAPTLSLGTGAAPSWQEAGGVANATPGSGAVAVAPGATLSDAEQTTLDKLTVQITNVQPGDLLALANPPSNLKAQYDTSSGLLTISGVAGATPAATVANYQDALRAVTYSNSSDNPDTTNRSITITASDGQNNNSTRSATLTLSIAAANDAPTLIAPASISATEDTPAALNLSAVSVADGDGEATTLSLTLAVAQGTLKANDGAGVSVTPGSTPSQITLAGTAASINAYLQGSGAVTFNPASQANGPVSLSYSLRDGSALAATTGTTTINVAAVNDAAVFSGVPSGSTPARMRHGTATSLQSLIGSTPISLADSDLTNYNQSGITQVTLSVNNASLGGLSAGAQSGGATLTITNASSWQVAGTLAQINAVLAAPAITVQSNAAGAVSLIVQANDGSNVAGSTTSAGVQFLAVSDPLINNSHSTNSSPRTISTGFEESLNFLSITDPDAGANPQIFTLTINDPGSNGVLFGLKDADSSSGIQLRGTAAEINQQLGDGRFQALADGATSLQLSLSNGVGPALTSTVNLTAVNTPPGLTTVGTLSGGQEDGQLAISFADLSAAADDSDKGGSVEGFVVKAITSGTLLIGTTADAATAWAAGINDRINPNRSAYWTPASNANGTGNNALAAFTVVALDNSGAESSTPVPVTVDVAAVNDAPSLSGIPSSPTAVTTAQSSALADFTVSDSDSSSLTLTLEAVNGSIGNLTDADTSLAGIQLRGSASTINAAVANATFNATTNGAASISLRLEDGGNEVINATYGLLASKGNSAPSLASQSSPRLTTSGLADSISYISVSDLDEGQTLSLSLNPSGGSFRNLADVDPNASGIQLRGTVGDINTALDRGSFVPSAVGNASIAVAASDGIASPVSFTYTLIASNLEPTLSGSISLSGLTEDLASTITYKDLLASSAAADSNGSVTGFKVTAVDGSKGSLKIAGANWVSGINDTIDAGRSAEWMPAANLNGTLTAALTIKAIDDLGDLSTASDVAIAVAAVNDAPSLSGNASFANTTEDAACTAIRVRDLLNGNSPSRSASDVSNETASTDLGLAIIASSGLGTWQYTSDSSISNSTVWQRVGGVSAQSSLLLSAGTWLRYLPDPVNTPVGGETGIGITYRSWDTSESTAGSRVDTSINGGSSAFSATTATATLTVSSVDDPLTLSLSRETTTSNTITAAAITYQELDLDGISGNDLQLLDSGLSLNDPDSSQTRSAVKLLINSGLVSAEDRLELQGSTTPSSSVVNGDTILTSTLSLTAAGTTATVTAKYNQNDGVFDLSTTASQSEAFWQEVLRNVGYRNSSDTPTTTLNGQPRVVQVEMLADSMFVRRDANGLPHFYEYVSSDGISWTAAEAAARSRAYAGMSGYLATITTQAENDFIAQRLTSNGWIGGSDAIDEGQWRWVTGPENGTQFSSGGSAFGGAFTNWGSGEPNNSGSGEDYAQIRADTGKWNDLPDQPSNSDSSRPRGYLVEYSDSSVTDISFSKTFNLSIQAGNDAPVLGLSGYFGILGPYAFNPSLSAVNEDASTVSNGGNLVSSFIMVDANNNSTFTDNFSLVDANGLNTITDVDTGAPRGGIAITSLSSGNGTWQYRLNNSGSWLAMGSLSAQQSLLLRPADAVRFLPDGNNGTSASFTYRAWDQSSGTAGSLANTSQNGGSTAFSLASNTASISVTAVNDAPSWSSSEPIKLATIARSDDATSNNFTIIQVADLVDGAIDDVDFNATTGIAITAVGKTDTSGNALQGADSGKWQYRTATNPNTTLNWLDLPSVSTTQALLLSLAGELRYLPNTSATDTLITTLSLRAWDTSGGTTGNTVNVATAGGSSAFGSNSRQASVRVNGVTLSNNLSGLNFTEGGTAAVGSGLSLSSLSGSLNGALVQIVRGLSDGDQLQLASSFSSSVITSQWNAATGVLTLSGTASASQYETALKAVEFRSGDDPTALVASRTIGFFLGSSTTTEAYLNLAVTATADKPLITAGTANGFREGQGAVAILPNLILSDADDKEINGATVKIASSRLAADVLALPGSISSSTGISATYDSNTGFLTLTGRATLAEYQQALRAVTFENTSSDPTNSGGALTRRIDVVVTDANSDALGAQISETPGTGTATLIVDPINNAPALSAGMSIAYTEGPFAVALSTGGTVTITDADVNDSISSAVLEIFSGYTAGDELFLPGALSSTGISGSWDASTHRLTLSGTRSRTNYQSAIAGVAFRSSSDDPTASSSTRQISIQVRDANSDGASSGQALSNTAGATVTITPTADAPVVTITNATTPSFSEAGSAVALASATALSLSDADDSQLTKAVVSISSGFTSGDQLAYTPVAGITGNYDKALGQLTFAGPASLADYERLLRSITYSNDTAALGSGSRTISWTVLDAKSDGLTPQWSTSATSTVTVTGINQAPTLAVASLRGSYVENDAATVVQEGITLNDLDSTQLSGATVSITQGFMAGDTLALASSSSGITANYNSSTGVLSLTGIASIGAYQQALGAITYSSTSDDPTAGNTVNARTLTWQVTDQDNIPVTSVASTSTLQVVRVNDNPTLTAFAPANPAAPAIVSGGEDQAIPVTYAALIGTGAAMAQVADVDGTVMGLKVFELLSGSLRLGSSASAALDYVAGINDTITSTINAYWTPAANVNGTAANALEAFSVVAVDDFGAVSIAPRSVWVDVNPDRADGAQISKLILPANGIYTSGQSLDFSVVFDRAVSVATSSGAPTLPITLNSGSGAAAEYRSGSGTSTLVFRYTVRAGDSDSNGLAVGSAIALNGGAITSLDDGQAVTINLTLPGFSSTAGLLVDGVNDAPELSSPTLLNARYSEGDAAIRLNPDLALSDSDSSSFSIATVRISAGFTAGDGLALSSEVSTDTGVVASWNANTGTLTLTPSTDPNAAAPTLLHALRALRAVTFASSSDHPTGTSTSRTVEWQVSDNTQASSNLASGSFTITPVNDAPTFSLLSTGVVRTQEDTAAEISVQTLAGVSNASDVDGVVTAYVVKAVTSGSLKLGSTAQSATDWVAGSNDVIDRSTKAFWTPERDVNGNGINAFTVVARDNGGSNALTSSTPVAVTVDVTPVADIAQITSFQMPAPGTYGPGSVLQFAISFDRAISLNSAGGVPSLSLQLDGNRSVQANLVSPQASYGAGAELVFGYAVQAGDLSSSSGIGLPSSLELPQGSSLTNLDGDQVVAVNLALPAATASGVLVDGVQPFLTGIKAATGSDSNRANQTVRISFSEAVRHVDASDFRLGGTGSATGVVGAIQAVNPSNGAASSYDLTINEIKGLGRLVLTLKGSDTAIADAVGNALAAGKTLSGSIEVDRVGAISTVGVDNRLSLAEITNAQGVKVQGTVSELLAGQQIELTSELVGTPGSTTLASATVRSDGSWSAVVPLTALNGLTTTGDYTWQLNQGGGALATSARTIAIDRLAPSLSDPTQDQVRNPALVNQRLNRAEISDGLTIQGSSDAEDQQTVEISLGDLRSAATVLAGSWQVEFSNSDLARLSDGSLDLSLTVSDRAGNSTTAAYTLNLDTTASLNLAPHFSDGWINSAERAQSLAISGVVAGLEDGRTLTVTIKDANNTTVATSSAVSVSNGAFSYGLPSLTWTDASTYSVEVSGSDAAGNPATATGSFSTDFTAPSVDLQLAIDSQAPVDLGSYGGTVNAANFSAGVRIGSTAASDASTTLVTIGNNPSTLVAPLNGNWGLNLDPKLFSLPLEGAVSVTATVTDQAGNSAVETSTVSIDRAAAIALGAAIDGNNNQINSSEALSLSIAGTTTWVQNGASVSVELWQANSQVAGPYTAPVNNGAWSINSVVGSSWPEGALELRATVTDSAGNRASATQAIRVNRSAPGFIATAIAGDNLINAAEVSAAIGPSISGLVENAEDGQLVSITLPAAGSGASALAARTLTAEVVQGIWTLPVPADLLAAYAAANSGGSINYQVANLAGNSASGSLAFQVDTLAPTLSLDSISEADWGAAATNPAANPITITGTVLGLETETDRTINVLINGTALQATRNSTNATLWSLSVPTNVLRGLRDSGNSLELSVSDRAGNGASFSSSFNAPGVPTKPPIIAIPIDRQVLANEGDGLIRQFQANQPVSWSLAGIDPSLVNINASTGSFSFHQPISLTDQEGDLSLPFTLIGTDARGNQSREDLVLVVDNLPDATSGSSVDSLDQDGIAADVEDAASNGRTGTTAGDLNNDGIADRLQPNVAAVPWINQQNFQDATADPRNAIPNSFASLQASPAVRITDVRVRQAGELVVPGNGSSSMPALLNTATLGASNNQATVTTPYDPLVFKLQSYDVTSQQILSSFIDAAPALADGSDPYPGMQVRMTIDLPSPGLAINSYLKWNPSANLGAGGWFEFLADGDAATYDNGAELIDLDGDGLIDQIRLTYTDGNPQGGDIDGLVNGIIEDPGMPALLQASVASTQVAPTTVTIVTADGPRTLSASFYGGTLISGSIRADTPDNLDSLNSRQSLGSTDPSFAINGTTLGFGLQLSNNQTQASLYGDLDLIGADLAISVGGQRQTNRRLAYYGFLSGAARPLIYNPIEKAGARFYDRSGDGIADFLSLAMVDAGYGDYGPSGLRDGSIVNDSTAAVVESNTGVLGKLSDNTTLTVADTSNLNAPINFVLKASLRQRSSSANQIGYVVFDPSEVASAASFSLEQIKARSQTLFSTLESSDVTLSADPSLMSFEREILLVNGQSVRFFEVADASLDEISSITDARLRFFSLGEFTGQQAFLTSSSGVKFQLDLLSSDQGLNALIGQEQGRAAVLDFSTFSGSETVTGSLVLAREASYDSITGFYRTLDLQGSVRDALGAILRPGDAGYSEAARFNLVSSLSSLRVGDRQSSNAAISITESTFLAPMAMVNGDTYFAFADASSDKLNHFKVLGTNLFGLEDMRGLGDRDYDDLVIGFSFAQIAAI